MPLYRRIPKRGFHNKFSKKYVVLNVRDLNQFRAGTEISPDYLIEKKIVKTIHDGLRILGEGDLKKRLRIRAHHISSSARKKIEDAGGSVEVLG
jgi:large subunit ribosomal protein L15